MLLQHPRGGICGSALIATIGGQFIFNLGRMNHTAAAFVIAVILAGLSAFFFYSLYAKHWKNKKGHFLAH